MVNQPSLMAGALPSGMPFSQDTQPGAFPSSAPNMPQSQTFAHIASHGSNAPAPSLSSSAPPLGPSASAPSIMHSGSRPPPSSQSRQPPTMPAGMMAARKHSAPNAGLPPRPQAAPPSLPSDDVLSGSPEISRRSSTSFPSSASYPSSTAPASSSYGRGYERNGNNWNRGYDYDRDNSRYPDRDDAYDPRDHSYRDQRRGSGQYGYRSDYSRDSGWR